MPRAATTSDPFNAIAEPQRRAIVQLLAGGERSVSDIAKSLRLEQPQTSKHLAVLREVGLVEVRSQGKQRLYRLHSEALKPVHEWVSRFEHLWDERLDRLEQYLEEVQNKGEPL